MPFFSHVCRYSGCRSAFFYSFISTALNRWKKRVTTVEKRRKNTPPTPCCVYNMHPEEITIHQRNVPVPLTLVRWCRSLRQGDYEAHKMSVDTNVATHSHTHTFIHIFWASRPKTPDRRARNKQSVLFQWVKCARNVCMQWRYKPWYKLNSKITHRLQKYARHTHIHKKPVFFPVCSLNRRRQAIFLMDAESHMWWSLVKYDLQSVQLDSGLYRERTGEKGAKENKNRSEKNAKPQNNKQ